MSRAGARAFQRDVPAPVIPASPLPRREHVRPTQSHRAVRRARVRALPAQVTRPVRQARPASAQRRESSRDRPPRGDPARPSPLRGPRPRV